MDLYKHGHTMLRKEQCFLISSFFWGFSIFSSMKNFGFYKCLEKQVSLLTGKSKALAVELSSNERKWSRLNLLFDYWLLRVWYKGGDAGPQCLAVPVPVLPSHFNFELQASVFSDIRTLFFVSVLKISLQRTSQSSSACCKTLLPPHKPTQPLPIPHV